jgi:nucleoside-diphosphate-sugar epimerase
MKVLVAGATGALGTPTVRRLVAHGHEVYGLTRSQDKAALVHDLGATPVLGDVLDPDAIDRVVSEVKPEGIIQLLNALPKRGPLRPAEMDATNELREVGTKNLVAAATSHRTRRFVVESMIFGYGYGDRGSEPLSEDAPFGVSVPEKKLNAPLRALADMEELVLGATARGALEGVVLRLGLFYGPGVGSTEFMISMLRKRLMFLPGGGQGKLSWIHVEDGASAVVAALETAAPGSVFNVVDDEPASFATMTHEMSRALQLPKPKSMPVALARIGSSYAALMAQTDLRASNARIKRELGWEPRYPTYREGIASIATMAVA